MKSNDSLKETIDTYNKTAEEWAYKHRKNLVERDQASFIQLLAGNKILDAGCGHGVHAKRFSEQGKYVRGIDLSDKLLELASRYATKAVFQKMDMRQLDFPDEYFDGVWACASMLHLTYEDARKTIKEFHRVLTCRGILYVSVKRGEGEKIEQGRHFSYYNSSKLENMLSDNNFEHIISVENKDWIAVHARKP